MVDGEFDLSPRPVKKRKLVKGASKATEKPASASHASISNKLDNNAIDDFAVPEDDYAPVTKPKRGRPKKKVITDSDDDGSVISAASKKGRQARRKTNSAHNDHETFAAPLKSKGRASRRSTTFDSDEDGSLKSVQSKKGRGKKQNPLDEFDDEGFAKPQKPKYNIYIPEQIELKDTYVDSNAPPPSTNPWEIRGAIWKKDPTAAKSVFDTVSNVPRLVPPFIQSHHHHLAIGSLRANSSSRETGRPSRSDQDKRVLTTLTKSVPRNGHPKDSDIPACDDLDAEDWAQLNDQDANSVGSQGKQAQATRVAEDKDPVEDPLMMDDLDTEDWDVLEEPVTTAPTTVQALMTGKLSLHTKYPQLSAVPKLAAPVPTSAPIEISDDTSDKDDSFTSDRMIPGLGEEQVSSKEITAEFVPHNSFTLQKTTQFQKSTSIASYADELADLPSDAFDSEPSSPVKQSDDIVRTSIQRSNNRSNKSSVVAPQNGLVQTTLFGGKASLQNPATGANKKHNWPLATQPETATHHRLDQEAINTWIYPTNLGTIRDYQYNIVSRGLFHNLLVALPTGLGKTFIAATVMLNWFRWAPDSQIVFVAPTKPLVAQQIDACFQVVGIPRSETVMLTGETKPAIRAEEWKEKRVFFMTPQTIINDLKHGYCDPKRIVLVVVDEAHRATGGYAYVEMIKFLRRFNQSFRVLALTATPGANVEAVQQVIDGLDISRVEIRTETSIDIRQYVHTRDIDTMKFDYSDEQSLIMELLSKAIQPVLTKLNGQNAYWLKDPMKLTAFGCTLAQKQWSRSEAGRKAPHSIKGMVASIFPVLASLAHGISLLKFHGVGPFFRSMSNFRNEVDGGSMKSKYAKQIREDQNFNKMMGTVQNWVRNPDFLGHPKLEYLRNVVMEHFLDCKDASTKVMIFAHWRDSAEEIVRVMNRNQPMIRAHVFVGQQAAKGSEGMTQKRQLEVIQQFKESKYNTLVATSIGEEGLDIGEVDLIVCYDASASPIRMLQRMGRTGRKRKGNIVLLLMKDKEDTDFEKAKDNYEKMQAMISEGTRFTFHDDKSPRILPRGVNPSVDKRVVEIPIENSQADLPEPDRRKRVPKKPPKKFHMPDNVRTGFVSASRMDESGDEEEIGPTKAKARPKKARPMVKKQAPVPQPEVIPLPFMHDVFLNKVQERELERKYQNVNDAADGVPTVTAPRLDRLSMPFPGPSRLVKHGQRTLSAAAMMQKIRNTDLDTIQILKDNLHISDFTQNVDHLVNDSTTTELDFNESDVGLPALPASLKKTGRKNKVPSKSKTINAAAAKARLPKSGARTRKNSSDMEEDESEPEATPAEMRIGTQGIQLGSEDTLLGEDHDAEDEEPDSELAEFVVGSDAPIEMVSSSLPRIRGEDSEDDLSELNITFRRGDAKNSDSEASTSPVRKRLQRGRKAVMEDSDD